MLFAASTVDPARTLLGVLIIFAAIYCAYRRLDVRLVLFTAALALGSLGGDPMAIVRKFLETFVNEKFIIPICTAMGFAYVLRHTGCDQHLVHMLVKPLSKMRVLLIPGTVVVGFLVNMPVVSQTSTAVTIGTVLIPVLMAARLSAVTVGAALLLGSSIGGELLNPGAPELRTTITETEAAGKRLVQAGVLQEQPPTLASRDCVERLLPYNLLGLGLATAVFWVFSLRSEAKKKDEPAPPAVADPTTTFRVNYLLAAVPLIPLVLLYVVAPPLQLVTIDHYWLEDLPPDRTPAGRFDSRVIGLAMLVGSVIAALVVPKKSLGTALAFSEGAGYGYTHIISLIVAATCFGEGIRRIGLDQFLGAFVQDQPVLLIPTAGVLSVGFGVLSGSGMATAQSIYPFFAEPALRLGMDPALVGAVVSLGAAAGRTMSPVAAVALMCATMTQTNVFQLTRRTAIPLLVGMTAVIIAAMIMVR